MPLKWFLYCHLSTTFSVWNGENCTISTPVLLSDVVPAQIFWPVLSSYLLDCRKQLPGWVYSRFPRWLPHNTATGLPSRTMAILTLIFNKLNVPLEKIKQCFRYSHGIPRNYLGFQSYAGSTSHVESHVEVLRIRDMLDNFLRKEKLY